MKNIVLIILLALIFYGCKKQEVFEQGAILKVTGEYTSILPCPDCEGINYEINLKEDMTYTETMDYLGKKGASIRSEGKWELEGLDRIKLYKKSDEMSQFIVSKKDLVMLDPNGKRYEGKDAEKYILKPGGMRMIEKVTVDSSKIPEAPAAADTISTGVNGKWKLIEINGQKPDEGNYMTGIPDLEIREADKKFSSNSGCNRTNGGVQIVGDQMSFSKFFQTRSTCPGTGESEYVNALRSVDSYKVDKGILILNSAGKTVLKFKRIS